MNRGIALLFGIGVAACGNVDTQSPPMDGSTVTVGAASLEVPVGWQATIQAQTNRQVWVPSQNDRKESLAVRVIDRADSSSTADDVLDDAVDAEGVLADVHLGTQKHVATRDGAPGLWIDLTFTPSTANATYARTQLTLVTAHHIIHILYTALHPDPDHRAIDLALATVGEEG